MDTQPQLHLRPANINDAKILFAWRNDKETRKNSCNTDEIPWEVHLTWLTKNLSRLYIAESNHKPIGSIRADKKEKEIELSWTVAPEARGQGFGKAMMLQFVKEICPKEKFIAKIKKGNKASEEIAESLGLHQATQDNSSIFILWR